MFELFEKSHWVVYAISFMLNFDYSIVMPTMEKYVTDVSDQRIVARAGGSRALRCS